MGKNLLSKAEKLRHSGDYEKAAILYKKFIKATDPAVDGSNSTHKKRRTNVRGEQMFVGLILSRRLDAFIGLADTLRILGRFAASRKYYKKAAGALKNSVMNSENKKYLLGCNIGDALCDKGEGKYKLALLKLNKIKKIAGNQKDSAALGFILWHIGMIFRFLGELGKSKKYLALSLEIHNKIKDSNGVGFSLCGIGGSLRASGRVGESLKFYMRANRIFRKNRDAYGLAYSFCGMASAYKAMDRIKDAIFYYGNSELLYIKIKDLSSLAFVCKGLAGCYLKTGCKILSDFYFSKALRFFKKSGDARGLLSMYLEKLSGRYDKSAFDEALKIVVKNGFKFEVKYLNNYSEKNPQKWLG